MATRVKIGRIEIQALVDCAPPPFPPPQFFPDVPLEAWEPHRKHALDKDGKFQTNFGFFLLRASGAAVVVDTGLGPGPHERLGGKRGNLVRELARVGVSPRAVSAVVLTHLHGDHIGWNVTRAEGGEVRPTFPNARYVVSEIDWEYWTSPDTAASTPAIGASVLPLKDLGVLNIVNGEHPVIEGVRTLPAPGHTPGHQCVLIESDGERGLVVGDLFHSSAQVTEPEWCAGADMDKDAARRTRRALIARAVREQMTLAAGHLLIDSNIGHVVEVEGRRYWQAL